MRSRSLVYIFSQVRFSLVRYRDFGSRVEMFGVYVMTPWFDGFLCRLEWCCPFGEIMIIHLVLQEFELAVYLQLLLTLLEILVILYTTLSMTTKNNSVVPIKNLLTKIFIMLDLSNRSNKTIMIQVVQELNITGNRF